MKVVVWGVEMWRGEIWNGTGVSESGLKCVGNGSNSGVNGRGRLRNGAVGGGRVCGME